MRTELFLWIIFLLPSDTENQIHTAMWQEMENMFSFQSFEKNSLKLLFLHRISLKFYLFSEGVGESLHLFHGLIIGLYILHCIIDSENLLFCLTFKKCCVFFLFYFIDFRERQGEGERERETSMWERNIAPLSPGCTLTGDRTWNLGMCPNRELNWWPLGAQEAQPTEPHQQGLPTLFIVPWTGMKF